MRHLSALLILLALASPVAAEEADAILGLWQTDPTDQGYARVEISRDGELYSGRIVWLSEPDFPAGDEMAGQPKLDRFNPDPGQRGRAILGLPLMEGFRFAGDLWKDGRIYDPETGKTYRCKMSLASNGRLRVRGFLGVSLLGRTTVWVRAPRG